MQYQRTILNLSLAAGLLLSGAAVPAGAEDASPCSVASLAGKWVFATDVGQQSLIPDVDGDITAIGTMNVDESGNVEGVFDNNFADFMAFTGDPYSGSLTVGENCLGELTFVTGAGGMRTDTIAIISSGEFLGMSRDPNNLWTYQARRISAAPSLDSLTSKVDAIMRKLGLNPAAFE